MTTKLTKLFFLTSMGFAMLAPAVEANSKSVPVSVLKFVDKSNNAICRFRWDYWNDHLGSSFQDMLITDLTEHNGLEVLERADIKEIYDDEVELINSEKSKEKIQKGHFKKARYTFIGTVSGFEYCSDKKKGNVKVGEIAERAGIGGLFGAVAGAVNSVGAAKATAKVVIDVRLVNTTTGRIVKSVRAEGTAERSNLNFDTEIGDYESSEDSPVVEAARNAIKKASAQLVSAVK